MHGLADVGHGREGLDEHERPMLAPAGQVDRHAAAERHAVDDDPARLHFFLVHQPIVRGVRRGGRPPASLGEPSLLP